jgi:HPt (histidine-containing phosphotransfer) domain-containing protein
MKMDPSLPVLNRDEALGRLEGDVELWNEIRNIWLEDIGSLMDGVAKALQTQVPDALRRAAHALKGASANVGAVRVASVAKQIEIASLSGDWNTLTNFVTSLGSEVEEAKRQLGEA